MFPNIILTEANEAIEKEARWTAFISKVINIPLAKVAAQLAAGKKCDGTMLFNDPKKHRTSDPKTQQKMCVFKTFKLQKLNSRGRFL